VYDGSTYSIDFYAESEDDAKARIEAMRGTMSNGHQTLEEIDAGDDFDADDFMDKLRGNDEN
jgi:hypothetical protein